ncbi:arabinan endo-1,5-alpha-L-arabinosidase [uncultured Mucilaginibacter sp.]|uniref:arabinan endo-1,5-alpha-L-arabinosidase n=1 Tax=uncultured Mucilaginibacter sp. TaxID=797541 RepID=UPI0025F01C63|nr:arabinan endo-1,5-alpha-L-arabinosidase [uncultured Mucilaginibacter sp.]
MKTVFSGLMLLVILCGQASAQQGQQQNKIIENNGLKGNLNVHDPCMIKAGDTYYVFYTGLGIKTSKDMVNWTNVGPVFDRSAAPLSWWNNDIKDKVGLWAPDIHYADGQYHLYYSVSAWMNFNSSVGYATNVTLDKSNPNYKWVDHGQVIGYKNGGDGVNCIDPNVFTNKDGREWMIYGSYKAGLRLVELDPKTGKPFFDKPELYTITTSLGEGSYIIKGPEYYYVFASRGKCCSGIQSTYQIVMGRSKSVMGPYLTKTGESWLDNKYSLFLAGNYDEPGRGHNGFFAQGDTTYIVYHAYTRLQNGASLLNIKPMYMDADGWPTIEPANNKLFQMADFEKKVFIGK